MNWKITEDKWTKDYKGFLVDEGKIQYSFKNRVSALKFKKQGYLNYMLLTNLDIITNDTMLDPREFRSWGNKMQICIDQELIG